MSPDNQSFPTQFATVNSYRFHFRYLYKCVSRETTFQTKALFAEIILPLEQKLENEFKNAVVSTQLSSLP